MAAIATPNPDRINTQRSLRFEASDSLYSFSGITALQGATGRKMHILESGFHLLAAAATSGPAAPVVNTHNFAMRAIVGSTFTVLKAFTASSLFPERR